MPSYLSPGVYVEEVQGGARPIEGTPTPVQGGQVVETFDVSTRRNVAVSG